MNDIEALVIEWRDARAAVIGHTDWIDRPLRRRQEQLARIERAEEALMARAKTMFEDRPVGPCSPLPHLCEDCPPAGHPTDATRCAPCPRRKP